MEILSFKTIVRNAISELISCEPFYDVAKRNWQKNEGAEEELYPYLTEMIHKELLITYLYPDHQFQEQI